MDTYISEMLPVSEVQHCPWLWTLDFLFMFGLVWFLLCVVLFVEGHTQQCLEASYSQFCD